MVPRVIAIAFVGCMGARGGMRREGWDGVSGL